MPLRLKDTPEPVKDICKVVFLISLSCFPGVQVENNQALLPVFLWPVFLQASAVPKLKAISCEGSASGDDMNENEEWNRVRHLRGTLISPFLSLLILSNSFFPYLHLTFLAVERLLRRERVPAGTRHARLCVRVCTGV